MRKKRQNEEEQNYWQSATDLMAALVFILLLIIALLAAFILIKKDGNGNNLNGSGAVASGSTEYQPREQEQQNQQQDSGGGGGQQQEVTPTPTPEADEKENKVPYKEGDKSAVYVQVKDAESGKAIKEAGVKFQLFQDNALQTLYHYYPEKEAYTEYATTENGDFYLPEKIAPDAYTLKETSEPKGYDATEPLDFTIDSYNDWDTPYLLQVALSPSKNKVQIQVNDSDGKGVADNTFDIIAAEEIKTADGTVRYKKGDLADKVVTDDKGYVESKELFLGNYLIEQKGIAVYYAKGEGDSEIQVEKKNGTDAPLHTFVESKTKIHVTVTDEANPGQTLSGLEFTVTANGKKKTVTTDDNGSFDLDALEKDTVYKITQKTYRKDYEKSDKTSSVKVDKEGLIDGETEKSITITNRMIRVNALVRDRILRDPVNGHNVELQRNRKTVYRWTSGVDAEIITGLTPGTYTITDGTNQKEVTIRDTADEQNIQLSVMTGRSYLILAGFGIGILLLAGIGFWIIRRRKKDGRAGTE